MASTDAASEAQVGFVTRLLRERETARLTAEQQTWLEDADFTLLNRGQIGRVIDTLKELPHLPAQHNRIIAGTQAVPNGRYAVTEGDGTLRFYKVNTPTEGKWAGFTFVDIQASDELYPLRDRSRKGIVLALIAKDPQEAMLRYGIELGHCGHCGRTLTNEYSRSIGIGPICRGKMGW
jgi:hypothetical protein